MVKCIKKEYKRVRKKTTLIIKLGNVLDRVIRTYWSIVGILSFKIWPTKYSCRPFFQIEICGIHFLWLQLNGNQKINQLKT